VSPEKLAKCLPKIGEATAIDNEIHKRIAVVKKLNCVDGTHPHHRSAANAKEHRDVQ